MAVRTLNYTNRKRIRRQDALIYMREQEDKLFFDADLHLTDYKLPTDGLVFVEAYRETKYMRFDWGKVGMLGVPQDRVLRTFDSPDGILFRVKVVAGTDPYGLLLAEADQIRPRRLTDEDENRMPLLPVKPDDNLGDEIWKIEFDDQQTLLLVNSSFVDWRGLARNPVFVSLVYPAVLRLVLLRIIEDYHTDTEDIDDWRSRWLRFSLSLPGVSNMPTGDGDQGPLYDWIDEVVSAFCRYRKVRSIFYNEYWIKERET